MDWLRRLKFWHRQPISSSAPAQQVPTAPKPPSVIYQMPPGRGWVPMWDFDLNAGLEARGRGWRDYEAVELWRDSCPKPGRVFTDVLLNERAVMVDGLWWRPLQHARHVDADKRTLH